MTPIPGFTMDLFAGQRIIVTGAAGGIGQAIAAAFAACGAMVMQLDRAEVIPAGATGWIACDLADRADLARAASAIIGPVTALIHCAGVFRRTGIDSSGGAIVNITSVRALTSAARAVAYTASKGGLAALTLALAEELAPMGIRVNAIAPGDVDTPMGRSDAAMTRELLARTPLGRMAQPEEVAAACVFLASPLASYITGATLAVDGGFLAV
jgi:NAD(P)-dependent dehydrogenase (short-subunit alcohol dehydrogenase family)